MYFNHKYKRVGPLWQGRFKSWFVYDKNYLKVLVKYIEYNPVKANITQKIGQYKWAMSSNNVEFLMLNFELIERIDFSKELDKDEQKKVDELYRAKFEVKDDEIERQELKTLDSYKGYREKMIYDALQDGYTQVEVAKYFHLSNVSISKIYKTYKQKVKLFNKLIDKGIFWSYSRSINYEKVGDSLFIEYLLKYGDFDDIVLGFKLFGKRAVKKVWEERLKSDKSFIKLNLMLARVFFDMDVESGYFKEVKNARLEKLRLLAS